jgi:NAD(P)-dependent dehydrogenase (short-subunit alcohol dehydrogenase family)
MTRITGKTVEVIPLDLSSFDSVRQCAAAIRKNVSHLDVLINNAALLDNPKSLPTRTDDGFDRVYQVNFLAEHLLIQELLPLLRSSNARVVNVASIASFFACPFGNYLPGCTTLKKLHKFAKTSPFGPGASGTQASNYGVTKYLDVFTTAELAVREPNITAVSLHPGIVSTNMVGRLSGLTLKLWCVGDGHKPCPRSAQQGASTQTYLAVASKAALQSGKYYDSCMLHKSVRDEHALLHGERATLTYESAIFDMASGFVSADWSRINAGSAVLI